jgi:hypothetical protein
MSKATRCLAVVATLAAIALVGTTTVAHAQTTDQPSSSETRRPPAQGQVGEAWHRRSVRSQQQTAGDAAVGRVLARERFSIPNRAPDQVPAPTPTQPKGHRGWFIAFLGVLVVLMLVAALTMLVARRARRRAPPPAVSPTR